jgi:hypothetical protein
MNLLHHLVSHCDSTNDEATPMQTIEFNQNDKKKTIFPLVFLPDKNGDTETDLTWITSEPNSAAFGFLVSCNTKSNASQKACVTQDILKTDSNLVTKISILPSVSCLMFS